MDRVRLLLDREAIRDVLGRYAYAVDFRDWEAFRSCFTDPVEIDSSQTMGGPPGAKPLPLDAFIGAVSAFFGRLPASQHVPVVLTIDVEGDRAHAISLLHARHHDPDAPGGPGQTMIGHYLSDLARTDEGWKITRSVHRLGWNEGNPEVIARAAGQG